MKKLNNKGFAISTMLYGILTIIIVILMLLLNIMRSAYNKENIAIEDISYYLDDCIKKQVALETCYKTSNDEESTGCSDTYKAYTTCLGLNKNNIVPASVAKLNELAIDLGDATGMAETSEGISGLIVDTNVSNANLTDRRYIYVGPKPRNHIVINDIEGRIMSIEIDGTIKVIVKDLANMQLDTNGDITWQNTTLKNELMLEYNNIEYKSKFTNGIFYTDNFYASNGEKNNDFDYNLENQFMKDYNVSYYGLPSVVDYLKASSNVVVSSNRCFIYGNQLPLLETPSTLRCRGDSNWMDDSGSCYWTTTKWIADGDIKYLTYGKDGIYVKSPDERCNAAMILVLKANTTVDITGTGDKNNPFIVDLR